MTLAAKDRKGFVGPQRRLQNSDLPVTVVVPVKNEEANLPSCLERLTPFQKVIVVDFGSSDRTREIAASYQAELIDFDWNGKFPKKRNWVLMNTSFVTPWVLFLDADEVLTDEFVQEVREKLTNTPHVGFWINYRNHFLGRHLKHGIAQRKLALFKVGAGLYERIEEARWSHLDMEVHEHPILDGSVGEIKSGVDHRDFRGLEHFIDRHNAYSSWEAQRYLQIRENPASQAHFTPRQKAKYRMISRWWYPIAYFCITYIARAGFMDGRAGLSYAIFKMFYFFQVREKIRELDGGALRSRGDA